jgi:hypothetical protein
VARVAAARHTGHNLTYALDRLGWLQFQQLCTRLLEFDAGLARTDWDGEADRWRVARRVDDLGAPLLAHELPGPVLVECSWARPGVGTHVSASVERLGFRDPEVLGGLKSYLLLCNGALEPPPLPPGGDGLLVAAMGPEELSARIDALPQLRLEMPSLLGLRDLDELIPVAIGERSTLDRPAAQELAAVFVPTRAHRRALDVLSRHRFVVLSGAPEMGKTAIARMIALGKMTDGWEAHECTSPDEVSEAFDPAVAQVFIADDAFGSTEYRADAAERWARGMERTLRALDDRHWLVWTSRPTPLAAALRRLHRERGAERFPAPGRVLIDAGALDIAEKTLILFRHAKAAGLDEMARQQLRALGDHIVVNDHFTPERIRRLVGALRRGEPDVSVAIRSELNTPTEAMATSFATLAAEHRDLLVALLDTPPGPVPERELTAALRRHHDGSLSHPPTELVDRLADHFLRVGISGITWVHPTWRDLVIEQLAGDAALRGHFISHCGAHGVVLALSTGGGAAGRRRLPLITDDADWDALGDRIYALVSEIEPAELIALLTALERALEALDGETATQEAQVLARVALSRAAKLWEDSHEPIALPVIEAWLGVSRRLEPPMLPTSLSVTWAELLPCGPPDLSDRVEVQRFADWLILCELLSDFSPALPETPLVGDHEVALMDAFLEQVHADLTGRAARFPELVFRALDAVASLQPELRHRAHVLTRELMEAIGGPSAMDDEFMGPEPEPEPRFAPRSAFDVRRVLADL